MKVLFACGGTAGHINPALAVAARLKSENSDISIRFVGNPGKMEARLVPEAGFDFAPLRIEGFQRRITAENVKRNILAIIYLLRSGKEIRRILAEFEPDVVVGTGGYVSGPVLRYAAKQGIPTLAHESNAYPGVTTRLLARYVDRVLLAVPAAKAHLPQKANCVVTGNPVRSEIFSADRMAAREKLGVGGRVCVVSLGGSLGARRINEAVAELIAIAYLQDKAANLHHIHSTGRNDTDTFAQILEAKGVPINSPHLDIREYIDDMPECLAAADIVICRSGAMTLTEIEAAGRASILIPSPNVSENHQYHNAMVLAKRNAAIVIEERDLAGEALYETVQELVSDPQELVNMGKNAGAMAIPDADLRICDEIYKIKK